MTSPEIPPSKTKTFSSRKRLTLLAMAIATSVTVNAYGSDWLNLRQNTPSITGYADINSVSDLEQATNSKMDLRKRWVNRRGVEFARWKQIYQGIPVYGETLITRDGVDGSFETTGFALMGLTDAVANMPVTITAEQAVEIVKKANNNPDSDNYVDLVYDTNSIETEIVIYRGTANDPLVEGETIKAWSVTYRADLAAGGDPRRIHALVDVRDGNIIIEPYNMIGQAKQATGPGGNPNGQYVWGSNGRPPLVIDDNCNFVNNKVQTIDLNGATNGGSVFQIADCSDNPVNNQRPANGGLSPVNDGHAFGSIVFDMYREYLGVNPLNFQLLMRVGYGQNFDNAFWDGRSMTFGDGANFFYPLVSLDVTAHEVSHGFTEQNSGLIYRNQSGGMNEAFSDMAGEAADFFLNRNTDFVTGDDITKNGRPLRSLKDPTSDGISIDDANNYTDGLDVHYSSGVYNKAFYNLATTEDWDIPTAFQVFAQANMAYWTPNSTFNQGACGVLLAARDLGLSQNAVTNAFADVNVSCPNVEPAPENPNPSPNPAPDSVALQSGVSVNNISGNAGDENYYTLDVPSGSTSVTFELSGGTGDADLYIRRGARPTVEEFDQRPYLEGNNEAATIENPQADTYHVMVTGFAAFNNVNLVATINSDDDDNASNRTFTSTEPVDIPDANPNGALSPINSTLSGNSGTITVDVDITHPWRGDLALYLIAPSGDTALLEEFEIKDEDDDVKQTYVVEVAGVEFLGRWQLLALDLGQDDTGTINRWSLTFNPSAANGGNDFANTSIPAYDIRDSKTAAPNPAPNPGSTSSSDSGGGGNATTLSLLVLLSGLLGLRRRRP